MKKTFLLFLTSVALFFSACSPSDFLQNKNKDNATTTDNLSASTASSTSTSCRLLMSDDGENNTSEGTDNVTNGSENNGDNNEGGGDTGGESSDSSHNFGQNCMSCHSSGGSGEKVFTAAGSIYETCGTTKTTGTIAVSIYPQSGLQGTPVVIPVDKSGNFYTTQTLTLGSTKITSTSGSTKTMSSSPTAACTSCHSDTGSQSTLKLD